MEKAVQTRSAAAAAFPPIIYLTRDSKTGLLESGIIESYARHSADPKADLDNEIVNLGGPESVIIYSYAEIRNQNVLEFLKLVDAMDRDCNWAFNGLLAIVREVHTGDHFPAADSLRKIIGLMQSPVMSAALEELPLLAKSLQIVPQKKK